MGRASCASDSFLMWSWMCDRRAARAQVPCTEAWRGYGCPPSTRGKHLYFFWSLCSTARVVDPCLTLKGCAALLNFLQHQAGPWPRLRLTLAPSIEKAAVRAGGRAAGALLVCDDLPRQQAPVLHALFVQRPKGVVGVCVAQAVTLPELTAALQRPGPEPGTNLKGGRAYCMRARGSCAAGAAVPWRRRTLHAPRTDPAPHPYAQASKARPLRACMQCATLVVCTSL